LAQIEPGHRVGGWSRVPQPRPDLPDQKLWRIERDADYGALNQLARGRLDLDKVRAW
jgi:hypothetical protein